MVAVGIAAAANGYSLFGNARIVSPGHNSAHAGRVDNVTPPTYVGIDDQEGVNQTVQFDNTQVDNTTYTYDQPASKDECKNGGWQTLQDDRGHAFKNEGDCVSFVATGGKNKGNG